MDDDAKKSPPHDGFCTARGQHAATGRSAAPGSVPDSGSKSSPSRSSSKAVQSAQDEKPHRPNSLAKTTDAGRARAAFGSPNRAGRPSAHAPKGRRLDRAPHRFVVPVSTPRSSRCDGASTRTPVRRQPSSGAPEPGKPGLPANPDDRRSMKARLHRYKGPAANLPRRFEFPAAKLPRRFEIPAANLP